MRIAFFNRCCYPDPEATGQYLAELAEGIAEAGEDVSVVCGRSYHISPSTGWAAVTEERREGVRVLRVFSARLPKRRLLFRLINLGTYLVGCILALFLIRRPRVAVSMTDPPLLPFVVGTYARLVRARFVFFVNDLYPDVAEALGGISNPLWLGLLKAATAFGLRHADRVVVLGDDMKERIIRKGCPARKVEVVPYWADTDSVRPLKKQNGFRKKHGIGAEDFLVMYSGNLGLSQNLSQVLHAACELKALPAIRFFIIGEGASKFQLRGLAQELGLDGKVTFLSYQPKARLGESLSAADLHLVPLARGAAGCIVPCKVYGIMASGTPYLAIMDRHAHVARIVRKHECGFWCEPDDLARLVERIKYGYENREELKAMGWNGRRAAEMYYARRSGIARHLRLLRGVASEVD